MIVLSWIETFIFPSCTLFIVIISFYVEIIIAVFTLIYIHKYDNNI